jgi:AraC-like DNA-binding protein
MTEAIELATVWFSTDDLPEKDRVAIWREHYARTAFRTEVEPAKGTPFHANMTSRRLPGLNVLWGNLSAARVARTRELLADGNDDLALFVNCTGAVAITAGGREVTLREHDAVLGRSDEVGKYDRFLPGRSLWFRIPRSILSPLVADLDGAVMRHISRRTEALRLLMGYSGTLPSDNSLAAPGLANLVANHMHDLVALTVGATRDAAGAAQDRGMRAARLTAAKTYIVQNSALRDLSVDKVAAHLGVSPRHLQVLFQADGTTFSAFLLNQRLARAHRMLSAPRSSRNSVSAIAYEVGFGDLSYFNRCFRKLYGLTPGDVRETAVNDDQSPTMQPRPGLRFSPSRIV